MNRLTLSVLGFAGVLALVAEPAAAQHRRGGEERGGKNEDSRGQGQQSEQRQQRQQQSEQRQQSEHAQPRQESRQQSQPAQAPPAPPRVDPGGVPRQGFERAVPRQGPERAVPPRQDVEHAVPRQNFDRPAPRQDDRSPRQGFNGRYDNRRYGYAAPRYVGPRYYSGYYNGPRYVGPRFTVAPRRFYRPYYAFRPRFSIGFGIWSGYPVTYYDPYYYPYNYYPYAYPYGATPGYVPPSVSVQPDQSNMGGLSFSITPDTAEVWVDGNYFGTVGDYGPDSQPLGIPAGRHHIELREPGFQVSSFDVDIVPGQVIPYQGALEP